MENNEGSQADSATKEASEQLAQQKLLAREKENQTFFLRKHVECFRITNSSLFPLRAFFSLASAQTVEGGTAKISEKVKQARDVAPEQAGSTSTDPALYEALVPTKETALPNPTAEFETYPFIVHPEYLELAQDETQEVGEEGHSRSRETCHGAREDWGARPGARIGWRIVVFMGGVGGQLSLWGGRKGSGGTVVGGETRDSSTGGRCSSTEVGGGAAVREVGGRGREDQGQRRKRDQGERRKGRDQGQRRKGR